VSDVRRLSLFEIDEGLTAAADVPVCQLCGRRAWRRASGEFHVYCSSSGCNSRERLCKVCGSRFERNVGEAGTKFCSTACKRVGYAVGFPSVGPPTCAWCGKLPPRGDSTTRARRGGGVWPYICSECTDPIRHLLNGLRKQRVPHEMFRRLLDDPGCEICHRDIVVKIRDPNTGRARSLLTVDHDHNCCPGTHSCGLCVRGLLCTQCNCAAGLLGDDAERALALARYVSRFAEVVLDGSRTESAGDR